MGTVTSVGSGNYNTGSTWDSGARPGSSDDVVIANGHTVTLAQDENANSLKSESGSTIVGGGFTITIDGQALGSAANIDGAVDAGSALNLTITTAAATVLDVYPSSGKITNLTINHASCVATLGAFTPLLGNLAITAGELNTDASNNYALTVTGDCIVDGTLTGNASAISLGSLAVGGTYSATSGTTTITSERSNGRAIDIVGTYTHNSGTLEIQTPADTDLRYPSSSSLNNLTINHASCIARNTGDNKPPIAGNLTISQGEFSTLDSDGVNMHDLTVTGHVSVDGTLTGNASAISVGSMIVNSGGTYSATSGTTTVTSENASHAFRVSGGGTFTNNDGTLEIQTPAQTRLKMNGTGNVHHLTVNHASCQLHMESDSSTTVEGNLTITAGIVNTNTEGGASRDLTVGGGIKNTGTLTANASTIIITGEIAGFAFDQMGTFNAGTSTVQIGDGSTSTVGSSTHFKSNNCHNLTINQHQDAPNGNVLWRAYTGTEVTIGGNLTVTRGKFIRNTDTLDLTVTGDIDVASVGQLGREADTGSNTFGSLTINSGGTFVATSGTTTITSMTSTGSGDRSLSLVSGGTFTNNSGTVLLNGSSDQRIQMAGTGNLYNLTINKANNEIVTFGDLTILNNLDVTLAADHTWRPNASSDTLTVHGNTYLTTGRINNGSTQYAGVNNWGNVTINSGEFVLSSGTNNFTGIRNIGGTVSQS